MRKRCNKEIKGVVGEKVEKRRGHVTQDLAGHGQVSILL
jgi:hypothetical protein